MAETDTVNALLSDVKNYLNVTWQNTGTDEKITGYINRGMKRLQKIAGASLDFTLEDLPRSLLLDYCRYANSQALEVFEKNFVSELLELNLIYQAPVLPNLVVVASADSAGAFAIKVSPSADDGNSYVYQVGAGLVLPNRLDPCIPGSDFAEWYGGKIAAATGQEIMFVEVNDEYEAVRAGKAKVSE